MRSGGWAGGWAASPLPLARAAASGVQLLGVSATSPCAYVEHVGDGAMLATSKAGMDEPGAHSPLCRAAHARLLDQAARPACSMMTGGRVLDIGRVAGAGEGWRLCSIRLEN
jgi:hypothetical protein